MSIYIKNALTAIWVIILVFWLITGFRTKSVKTREPLYLEFLLYLLPIIVAFILLGPGELYGQSLLREQFIAHSNFVGIIGLILCITGAVIACWARYLLGRNWSLSVQKKEDHELITGGPYRFVRHPIYTGLLLLFMGDMFIVGDYRGILAVVIIFVSFWFKLLKEEKLLTGIFREEYVEYQKQTKALIPFVL